MAKRLTVLTLLLVVLLTMVCVSGVLAGGPASGPRCFLSSTNTWDRLQQVDVAYDGTTVYDATYGCRKTNPGAGQSYVYFKVDDNYIYNGSYPIAHVAVTIRDIGTQPFALQYDGLNNSYQQITMNRTGTNGWKTFTFDIGDAKFYNREQGAYDFRLYDSGTQLYVSAAYCWCRKESAGVASISGGQFLTNGTRFQLVGADYIQPWQTTWANWTQAWGANYNSTQVERDFGQMEYSGATSIRAFLPFDTYISPSEGTLDSTVITHFQDFMTRAQNHGVKVILCVGGTPTWLANRINAEYSGWVQYADCWTSFLYRKETADFLVQLCNTVNMGQYDSFLGFDLENEPTFAYWSGTATEFYNSLAGGVGISNATNRAWNRWVCAKYASLANAYSAWGYQGPSDTAYTAYPETQDHFTSSGAWDKKIDDYYSFVADCFVTTTSYIKGRVQSEALSRALFTIDFVSRGSTDNLATNVGMVDLLCNDWRRCGKACDFIDVHIYNGYSTDSNWWRDQLAYFVAAGTDKPVVISEYGYPGSSGSPSDQEIERRTWQEIMNLCATAKVDGCMGWMWIDTLDTSVSDSTFGIRFNNDTVKPAWSQFVQSKTPFLLQTEPSPNVTVEVDIDSYISPWEQFYSSGRSLIRGIFDAGSYPRMINKNRDYATNDTIYHLPVQGGDPVVGGLGFNAQRGGVITYDDIPDFMVSGMTYSASIGTWNVGTTGWTENSQYRLGTTTANLGPGRWYLNAGETIPQWGTRTFPMTLSGPATPGTYTDTWKMLQEQVAWFGQGHSHSVKVIAKPTLGARITSFSIPQVVNRNSVFTATVTVRNEGTTAWTEAALVRLGASGDSDPFTTGTRQMLSPGESVATGQSRTFTITMTAPSTKGVYQTDWQMVQDGVAWFGQKIDVEVSVE